MRSTLQGQQLQATCSGSCLHSLPPHVQSKRHLRQPCRRSHVQQQRPHVLQARRKDSPLIAPFLPVGEDGQEATDIFNYLLRNRIIFIGSRINDEVATQIVASMLALEALDPEEDITLYINSQGGSPYSTIGILDTIAAVKPDVATLGFGLVAATATMLLAAGTKGKRRAMPNARIMMHQPLGGCLGSADDVKIQASELNRNSRVIVKFFERYTGLSQEVVETNCDRDNFMSPSEAKQLGLIDSVIGGESPTFSDARVGITRIATVAAR